MAEAGGEQQRVALAPKPKLLLMDEAFSSLDVELRFSIVPEVRRILKHEDMSAILVTHDQAEAFALADRVGVMNEGRIHQWDELHALYHRPATKFVARFVGEGELIPAIAVDASKLRSALGTHDVHRNHDIESGREVEILVRPDGHIARSHERIRRRDRSDIVSRISPSISDTTGERTTRALSGRLLP